MSQLSRTMFIWCAILWIPFLIIVPFLLLTFLFLFSYKWLVIILSKLFRKHDLVVPVSGLDIMFTTDDFYGHPNGSLAFIWCLEGTLSHEIITSSLEKALINCAKSTDVENSVDGYEKLTSVYPVFWMGVAFWKRAERKFNLTHHVKLINVGTKIGNPSKKCGMHTCSNDINHLICERMSKPFTQGQPLWEILFIPQITPSETTSSADLLLSEYSSSTGGRTRDIFPNKNTGETHKTNGCNCSNDHIIFREPLLCSNNKTNKCQTKSFLIFRTHHVVGDGNSMLRLLDRLVDQPMQPSTSSSKEYNSNKNTKNASDNTDNQSLSLKVKGKLDRLGQQKQMQESQVVNEEQVKVTKQKEKRAQLKNEPFDFTAPYFCHDSNTPTAREKVIKTRRDKIEEDNRNGMQKKEHNFLFITWVLLLLLIKVQSIWRQLSSTICKTFYIPWSLFSLVNDFMIHKDYWFTQKKQSDQAYFVTVTIPKSILSQARKPLCQRMTIENTEENLMNTLESSLPHLRESCYYYANTSFQKERSVQNSNVCHAVQGHLKSPIPMIVIAVVALSGSLRKLLLKGLSTRYVGKEMNKRSFLGKITNRKTRSTTLSKQINSANFLLSSRKTIVKFVIALPVQAKHPGEFKFCNFWTHGILNVDLSEPDSYKRVLYLNNSYWEMRNTKSPEFFCKLVKLYSVLPQPILSFLSGYNMGAAIGVTNMADSPHEVRLGGKKVWSKFPFFGLQWKHASLTLALLSYNEEMSISFLVNKSVIPKQENVETLLQQYFLEEIELLLQNRDGKDVLPDSVSHLQEGNHSTSPN